MDKLDEQLYEHAARELATKTYKQGLMAKAFTMSPNNEKQAFAHYIELRVEQLKEELREELQRRKVEEEREEAEAIRRRESEEYERKFRKAEAIHENCKTPSLATRAGRFYGKHPLVCWIAIIGIVVVIANAMK